MKQQLGAEASQEDGPASQDNGPASPRYIVLQRSFSNAITLTRERAPISKQILGWGVVVGIFAAALAAWAIVIFAGLAIYHAL